VVLSDDWSIEKDSKKSNKIIVVTFTVLIKKLDIRFKSIELFFSDTDFKNHTL